MVCCLLMGYKRKGRIVKLDDSTKRMPLDTQCVSLAITVWFAEDFWMHNSMCVIYFSTILAIHSCDFMFKEVDDGLVIAPLRGTLMFTDLTWGTLPLLGMLHCENFVSLPFQSYIAAFPAHVGLRTYTMLQLKDSSSKPRQQKLANAKAVLVLVFIEPTNTANLSLYIHRMCQQSQMNWSVVLRDALCQGLACHGTWCSLYFWFVLLTPSFAPWGLWAKP